MTEAENARIRDIEERLALIERALDYRSCGERPRLPHIDAVKAALRLACGDSPFGSSARSRLAEAIEIVEAWDRNPRSAAA